MRIALTSARGNNHQTIPPKPRPHRRTFACGESRATFPPENAATYPRIETLEEYVTIDPNPDAPEVPISRRADGWEPLEIVRGMDASFTLRSVALTLKVADLFVV